MKYIPGYFIDIISDNLHNLKELFLDGIISDDVNSTGCLVSGCPKLKVLHILGSRAPAESARCLLLGLSNLIEFHHPAMVLALEQIVKEGKTERVSGLRNLYIGGELNCEFGRAVESVHMVTTYLGNITKFDITERYQTCNENLRGLYESVSNLTCLTHLRMNRFSRYSHNMAPLLKAVGHQLRLLDLCCQGYDDLCHIKEAINQCRELRILRVEIRKYCTNGLEVYHQNYGDDLTEEFTPFCYLRELRLKGATQSYLKPVLCKSLIASPLLQELTLVHVPSFNDHVLKAAFNHTNDEGEQLAFTSLRKLSLEDCDFVTNYLERVVTDAKVPLESLHVSDCRNVTDMHSWDLGRFQMTVW